MSQASFIHAPFAAAAAVLLAGILVVALKFGLETDTLMILILVGVTGGLAWMTVMLNRAHRKADTEARQLRQSAERMQAMLATVPEAYCLFTPQGLLREVARVAPILGLEKISHFDDIVASLSEPEEFVAGFRRLQQTGNAMAMTVIAARTGRTLLAVGKRMRVGREGPLFDILWLSDNPAATSLLDQQASELVAAKTEARLWQAMIDAMPFPVWLRGTDLALTRVNEAYGHALDVTPATILRDQTELVSATARGGSGRALASTAIATNARQSERRHVIVGGKRHLFEISELPITISGHDSPLVLGVALNVTAEEERDTELQRHAAAQRDVLEHLGSSIAIYGPDMKLVFYNRAYARLWDADETFLNSKPTFAEVLEDLRVRRRLPEQSDFQRYKKERLSLFTNVLEPREDLVHLPNGISLRILVAPHPFGGLMFVHEDVTDKLALESNYNTLIAVQRETLDNLAEGLSVFGSDGRLRLYNPAFARIWRLQTDYLDKNPHLSDILEQVKPLFIQNSDWAEQKATMISGALDRRSSRGLLTRADKRVIEYVTAPLPDGAVLNSFLDVTDSVEVEEALRASNAALATADRLKSEFIANVSYQLRTPLNTIMGFAEILINQYFGTLNERQIDYARTIMEASRKLLVLINDVLDLATVEAGRMELERGEADIATLLGDVRQMSVAWAQQQQLEIDIDCPMDIGSVDIDANRIKQALFNLVSNAIKFTETGGRITLEARRLPDAIALSVIDTGIGIADEDHGRVFEKFERANLDARQSGAGLGLSLVKSFIQLHGGSVTITSAPGKGTRVTCILPVKQKLLAVS